MQQLGIEALPYQADGSVLFACIRDLPNAVFLDSSKPYCQQGRYDILSAQPIDLIEQKKQLDTNSYSDKLKYLISIKSALSEQFDPVANPLKLPFTGGVIGYLGYDIARQIEKLPDLAVADIKLPTANFGLYGWAVITDHHTRQTLFVSHPSSNKKQLADILDRFRALQPPTPTTGFELNSLFSSDLEWPCYQQAFGQIQEYIHAGDCYQINLAQRFSAKYSGDPWAAYLALRKTAAAPFSAYLQYDNDVVMSMSPERFLQLEGSQVTSSPIKGTSSRSQQPNNDRALAKQLLNSSKDRAENLMIVDLLRNDLGKSCKPGSITVENLFELQSFKTVHHLVSTIRGELKDGLHAVDLLAACFPGGSITGAPKLRAMEIIEQLETHRRSVYCGTIGYISCDGRMDTNIAIRTMLCHSNTIHCWAGGGIVADSDCAAEYQECQIKIEKLLAALQTEPCLQN